QHQFVYRDDYLNEEIGAIEVFNNKVYKVLSTRMIEGELYGYLKGQREIGWTKLKNSHYVFNKQDEMVFVKNKEGIQNELNITYQFVDGFTKEVQNKFLTSKGFIKYKGEFYELLFEKHKLIGFMKPSDIDVGYHVDEDVHLLQGAELYLESRLKTKAENISEKDDFTLKLVFPERGIGKVERKNQVYWIELNHVVEHQLERVFHSLQDYSSTENVEINDIIHNFLAERKKAKNILTALVNDKINNESNTNPDQIEGKSNIYTRYQNLKNSKLGKLQIKYWNMRKKWGK
ncbi:TPA: hypothetical protein REW56_002317, partial [Staphylococcus pseudintermedius]|nr:hypothetical protein [Staphylococcus pseudintermedius]